MVRDNVTGLIWENKTDDGSIHDKDNRYDWYGAQSVFIATLNSSQFGGYSDWRVPTIKELLSIANKATYMPSINSNYFPNTQWLTSAWSSTTFVSDPRYARCLDFNYGNVGAGHKSSGISVRAVRGGQYGEFGDFIDNGDGTVTDIDTGLMWQKATAPGTYTWQQALSYCENLILNNDGEWTSDSPNASGVKYNDWRPPNRNELQSLLDYRRYNPSINTNYFPNTVSSYYWSSTTDANYPSSTWIVDFRNGGLGSGYGDESLYLYVRAVRGGQYGSLGNFVDNGDGTVTDTDTGLMWQQATAPGTYIERTYNWEQALSYCENLTLAGYNDWQLPNVNDLQSLVDYNILNPAINTIYFPNTMASEYWSSTTYAAYLGNAWSVEFSSGTVFYGTNSKSYSFYVRAVRRGCCSKIIEKISSQALLSETLHSQNAILNNVTVSGDFDSTLNFTSFELINITTGSFAGKGFSKGAFETTLETVTYTGNWGGIIYLNDRERKVYLKGATSGKISATVEGYLTESVPESGIYDQYTATWKIRKLGPTATSATIHLNGTINYQSDVEYPETGLYMLLSSFEGEISGDYTGPLSMVLNHIRVVSPSNPYTGEGYSIISYISGSGSGQGWTYDKLVSPSVVELNGLFSEPMYGVANAILDECVSPRTLCLEVHRVDLGLPPMADLEVKTWGPSRVSPGQTVNYLIEARNDGAVSAENVVVVDPLPAQVEYLSSTEGGIYRWESHEVIWKLGTILPQTKKILSVKVKIDWGVPGHYIITNTAMVDTTSNEKDKYLDPEVGIYNLQEYLDYQPIIVTSTKLLSSDEFETELEDDNFRDLFNYAQEIGFNYINAAQKMKFSDESTIPIATMVSNSTDKIVFVTKLFEYQNQHDISLLGIAQK